MIASLLNRVGAVVVPVRAEELVSPVIHVVSIARVTVVVVMASAFVVVLGVVTPAVVVIDVVVIDVVVQAVVLTVVLTVGLAVGLAFGLAVGLAVGLVTLLAVVFVEAVPARTQVVTRTISVRMIQHRNSFRQPL